MASPLHVSARNVSSTLTKVSFNYYIIILTAFVFFLILSFYTFFLSIFGYFIFDTQGNNNKNNNTDLMIGTFVFFLSWLFITILLYTYLNRNNLLHM